MTLSRMVSAERCGQQPDCSGSTGEVTFEPGSEWQVRNWSASWGSLTGGGGKPGGSSQRWKEGVGRTFQNGGGWVGHGLPQAEDAERGDNGGALPRRWMCRGRPAKVVAFAGAAAAERGGEETWQTAGLQSWLLLSTRQG